MITTRLVLLGLVAAPVAARAQSSPPRSAMFRGGPDHAGVYQPAPGVNGPLRWRFQTGGPVRSSPLVADGAVYVGSADQHVYALDEATGALRWSHDAGAAVTGSPALAAGLVIVGTAGGRWLALDARTGARRWQVAEGEAVAFPWGYESGYRWTASATIAPAGATTLALLAGRDGVLRAVDARTGRERWRARTAGRMWASPAVSGGLVVAADADGVVYAFDLADGAPRWRHETEGHALHSRAFGFDRRTIQSSPAVMDGTVFVGARDGFLYALDLATGARRWRVDHQVSWINSSPAVLDGHVYDGSSDGRFVQDVDAATGAERWRAATQGIVWASPAVSGGLLYAADGTGRVYALDRAGGAIRWTWRAPAAIWSSPVVANGALVVGCDDGALYALDVAAPSPLQRAVYWDSSWARVAAYRHHADLRDFLAERGYQVLDAAGLARFMRARAADGAASVVVFAVDDAPPSIAPVAADTVLLRRYLEAGGRVVWPGLPPALWPADQATGSRRLQEVDRAAAARLLGVTFESGNFDQMGTSVVSAAGRALGIGAGWTSSFGADPASVSVVLATDETGQASAWLRRYGGRGGAFLKVPGYSLAAGPVLNTTAIWAAAEVTTAAR